MSVRAYLRKNIEEEKKAIRSYGKKPKGLNGKITHIRRDEQHHLRDLKRIAKGYREVK